MAANAPRQIAEKFRIPKAHVFARRRTPVGVPKLKWRDMGNCPAVTYASEITRQTYPSYQDSLNTPAYEPPTARTATLTIETQSVDDFTSELSNAASYDTFEQAAQTDLEYAVPGPIEIDDVVYLEKFAVTVKSFVSGAVVFVKNQHFLVDSQAGIVIVIALPDGYAGSADGEITFDAAEYETKQLQGLSDGTEIEMEFLVRHTNENGRRELTHFHFGKLSRDGDRIFTSDTDLESSTFTIPLSPDPLKPAPGYYTVTKLDKAKDLAAG